MPRLDPLLQEDRPLVVGAISEPAVLAGAISAAECDLIELRLDLLGTGEEVRAFCDRHAATHPILLTARHPDEGGAHQLSADDRAGALTSLLDSAAAIDLELRSLPALEAVWSEAHSRGLVRVASCHDFEATPGIDDLTATIASAATAGADIAKLACRLTGPADLHTLASVFPPPTGIALSVMGMGPLAPSSRLLAMQLGSVLNYGFLGDSPTAPGQWPARLLKQLAEAL